MPKMVITHSVVDVERRLRRKSERADAIGDGTFVRTFPHRQGTDGFFAAVFRRA